MYPGDFAKRSEIGSEAFVRRGAQLRIALYATFGGVGKNAVVFVGCYSAV